MSQSQIIRETFEKNGGIFKLIPTEIIPSPASGFVCIRTIILPWVLPAVQ